MTPDQYTRDRIKANSNMLVPFYLIHCFLYYVEDAPLISDALFDEMSRELLAKWETITHFHKHLISRDDLVAGTGFAIKYPLRVKGAARALARKFR